MVSHFLLLLKKNLSGVILPCSLAKEVLQIYNIRLFKMCLEFNLQQLIFKIKDVPILPHQPYMITSGGRPKINQSDGTQMSF